MGESRRPGGPEVCVALDNYLITLSMLSHMLCRLGDIVQTSIVAVVASLFLVCLWCVSLGTAGNLSKSGWEIVGNLGISWESAGN